MAANTSTKQRLGAVLVAIVASVALRFRRRRRRALDAADTTVDALSAKHTTSGSHDMASSGPDPAHAPGHRHLGSPPTVQPPRRPASWPRRADKNGHPPRF